MIDSINRNIYCLSDLINKVTSVTQSLCSHKVRRFAGSNRDVAQDLNVSIQLRLDVWVYYARRKPQQNDIILSQFRRFIVKVCYFIGACKD